jgi:hypothetical protein
MEFNVKLSNIEHNVLMVALDHMYEHLDDLVGELDTFEEENANLKRINAVILLKKQLTNKNMENKDYVYLWVLDFNDTQVYKYNIELNVFNEDPDYCEDYMQKVGHEISNVQWMVSPYDEVLDENNGWNNK